jgi:hypothetical protein
MFAIRGAAAQAGDGAGVELLDARGSEDVPAVCAGGQERCFERGEELMQDEIITNDRGGSQSNIGVRYDLIPGAFVRGLALLLGSG